MNSNHWAGGAAGRVICFAGFTPGMGSRKSARANVIIQSIHTEREMEEGMENRFGAGSGAFRSVRSVTQKFALQHSLSYNDIKHAAGDIKEMLTRFNRVRSLGGAFANVELSPYISRMIKVVGADRPVETFEITAAPTEEKKRG